MKKTLQILFLIIFCWQIAGVFLHFQASQQIIKNKSKKFLLESTNLISINIKKEDYKQIIWINKKEFRYGSELFDMKSISTKNNRIVIKCFNDKKENKLIKSTLNKNQNKDSKNKSNQLSIKILAQTFIGNNITFQNQENLTLIKVNEMYFKYLNNYDFIYNNSTIKPPIC